MKYLLDTHILLWILTEDDKLPSKVNGLIKVTGNSTYYSSVSMWEIVLKQLTHPDKITNIPPQELASMCEEANILQLTLKARHTYLLKTLSRPEDAPPHNDPFDRILIAQAKSENMLFLTHDDTLSYYNEPCIICV
ncbi:MAG: type II toxin-antitoxin system VapC family toxin [Synergistaceae bacterium]|nr:type II toxin-antitoxin system VapC family toxin [Synergistaceae bacterium]